jgi:hypothetical protein
VAMHTSNSSIRSLRQNYYEFEDSLGYIVTLSQYLFPAKKEREREKEMGYIQEGLEKISKYIENIMFCFPLIEKGFTNMGRGKTGTNPMEWCGLKLKAMSQTHGFKCT